MGKKTETDRFVIERFEGVPTLSHPVSGVSVTYIRDKETGEKVRATGQDGEEADRNAWRDLDEVNKRR